MKTTDQLVCKSVTRPSFSIRKVVTPSGDYLTGQYVHPLGLVTVYSESKITLITTFKDGQLYSRSRADHPTDRQITNFCRSLLLELHSENIK